MSPGFVLGAVFLASASFAVIQGEVSGYDAPWILALFGVSPLLCLVVFLVVEHRSESPMLDLSLFRLPPFAGSTLVVFAAYFGTFSIFFFTALYLQVVANASAYPDGGRLSPHGRRPDPRLRARRVPGWRGWGPGSR